MKSYIADRGTQFDYNMGHDSMVQIIDDKTGNKLSIPAKDILEFVANTYVRPIRMQMLEHSSPEELLIPSGDIFGYALESGKHFAQETNGH